MLKNLPFLLADIAAPDFPGGNGAFDVAVIIGALALVGGAALILRWLLKGKKPADEGETNLSIDVSQLTASGPAAAGPRLEFQGTPVRLAVLIVAPVGKNGILPAAEKLREVLENAAPNLMAAVDSQQPIFRRWPRQLSTQGFVQSFFNNVSLPGDRGKGTPWCAAAGRIDALSQQMLLGVVCCAEKENTLSQLVIESPDQWRKVLHVSV